MPGFVVQNAKALDLDTANVSTNLERVDTVVEEVTHQLRPGCLLLIGGVPDAWAADPVITTIRDRRVGETCQWPPRGALVPELAAQISCRYRGQATIEVGDQT